MNSAIVALLVRDSNSHFREPRSIGSRSNQNRHSCDEEPWMVQVRKPLEKRPKVYSAEKVRQGDIILRKPWQRIVFLSGLAAPFVLLLIWLIARHWSS